MEYDKEEFDTLVRFAVGDADIAMLVAMEKAPSMPIAEAVHFAVREALRSLAYQGFVMIVPAKDAPEEFVHRSFSEIEAHFSEQWS